MIKKIKIINMYNDEGIEIDETILNKDLYVWYACYGSNISYDRFMMYINGDKNNKYAFENGCENKSRPLESKNYIFNNPIYFAGESKKWTGGMAFLNYKKHGKSYGKIYKIQMNQFNSIFEQENELYDVIILLDYIDDLPVFTFTSYEVLSNILNEPSAQYKKIISKGLRDLDYNLSENDLNEYLKNKE